MEHSFTSSEIASETRQENQVLNSIASDSIRFTNNFDPLFNPWLHYGTVDLQRTIENLAHRLDGPIDDIIEQLVLNILFREDPE
jgi:hypothetical protein